MIKLTDDSTYEWVRALVDDHGVGLRLKAPEKADIHRDRIEDSRARWWDKNDVQDQVALHLGIVDGRNEIAVDWELTKNS